jgi:hypothetical protein
MPITFDTAAAGTSVAGPNTNGLTATWSHNASASAGVILAGFMYQTNGAYSRWITRTITYAGQPMTKLVQKAIGWGTPKKGFVELWGTASPMSGAHTISAGLAYTGDASNPWAPTSVNFSGFVGSSVSYDGATGFGINVDGDSLTPGKYYSPRYPALAHSSNGKMLSLLISAYMNSTTVGVLATTAAMATADGDTVAPDYNQNSRFIDSGNHLLIGDCQGPGSFRVLSTGGPWAGVAVNLTPN